MDQDTIGERSLDKEEDGGPGGEEEEEEVQRSKSTKYSEVEPASQRAERQRQLLIHQEQSFHSQISDFGSQDSFDSTRNGFRDVWFEFKSMNGEKIRKTKSEPSSRFDLEHNETGAEEKKRNQKHDEEDLFWGEEDLDFDNDFGEKYGQVEFEESVDTAIKVVPLKKCRRRLVRQQFRGGEKNVEQTYQQRNSWSSFFVSIGTSFKNAIVDLVASMYIYFYHSLSAEGFIVVINAVLVTLLFQYYADELACKLDFSILAFAVVFPLTFLIQQASARREVALRELSDLRALVLNTALAKLLWTWPDENQSDDEFEGRESVPHDFNARVRDDSKSLISLVYQFLSTPTVGHARFRVIPGERDFSTKVHTKQNDLIKRINVCYQEFALHMNVMKKCGFPSGEASRLHQYHWYIQQRIEALRFLKYYRTPQSTRSFGRVYIMILPWLFGPYFAWVHTFTGWAFPPILAGFSFLVLLGLLNTQKFLEDPFVEFQSGYDSVKVTYELSLTLQMLDLHFKRAEIRRKATELKAKNECK